MVFLFSSLQYVLQLLFLIFRCPNICGYIIYFIIYFAHHIHHYFYVLFQFCVMFWWGSDQFLTHFRNSFIAVFFLAVTFAFLVVTFFTTYFLTFAFDFKNRGTLFLLIYSNTCSLEHSAKGHKSHDNSHIPGRPVILSTRFRVIFRTRNYLFILC